jgi:hypothetical protein
VTRREIALAKIRLPVSSEPVWTATWLDPPFHPRLEHFDQAYGLYFNRSGKILLTCNHDVDGVTPY